jgi:peptidoglycan/xylan/chitin deacetylase (PgdA/CDA1 family)
LILLYHRIADSRTDPWSLAVTPRRFAEHLDVLKQRTRPIRLQQLSEVLLGGELPPRSVVVTFDDGYADNLHNVKPLLESYNVPATVFLATGHIGCQREFWWDELDRLLLQPGTLPGTLRLSINGASYRWELGQDAHYSEDAYRRHCNWRAWENAPSLRHSLYRSLWELLHPLAATERRKVLDELVKWACAEAVVRPGYRCLSLREVLALVQSDLIDLGAHTVTHPALSTLPLDSQRDEILRSNARLQAITGRPTASFAYPYGKQSDYTAETVSIVREAGFACACCNFAGVVERSTDRFQLPRVHVEDWDGEEFARRLSGWLDG